MAATASPTNTYATYLMYKATSSGSYAKLCDIKEFPDLGGDPDMLETTSMSDATKTYILGLQDMDVLKFTANYTAATFTTLSGVTGSHKFAVYFGENGSGTPDGHDGIFEWEGDMTCYVTGKGTNEVREIAIAISASTPIEFSTPS